MLNLTRIATTPDTRRIGEAIGFAGIDPREWIRLATVTAFDIDPDEGPFVDILMFASNQPDPIPERARVGSSYAGPGYGFYIPLQVDDEILVATPNGDENVGLVVVAKLWSPSDKPPANANSTDLILHLKADASINIEVSGAGKVRLGTAALTPPTGAVSLDGVVTGRGVDTFTGTNYGVLGNASTTVLAKR